MGYKNREIEVKLVVENADSLSKINNILKKHFKKKSKRQRVGISKDAYWRTPRTSKADFIRLRCYSGGRAQLTVKHTDKGDNLDRVEIDLEIDDSKKASLMLSSVFGSSLGFIHKRYSTYFLDNEDTTVSLYQIVNDKRVFLEVEARSKKEVFSLIKEVEGILPNYKLKREKRSLFQLFF